MNNQEKQNSFMPNRLMPLQLILEKGELLKNQLEDLDEQMKEIARKKQIYEYQLTELLLEADKHEASADRKSVIFLLLQKGTICK